jgi:hypothetical protein
MLGYLIIENIILINSVSQNNKSQIVYEMILLSYEKW